MDTILGDIDPSALARETSLSLRFDLKRMPVRWALSAIIADFFSEYLVVKEATAAKSAGNQRDTISYVLNELVENAVKFNAGSHIAMSVARTADGLVFLVSNGVKLADIDKVRAAFSALIDGDPGELLLKRIEQNAMGGGGGSGIGFLTLMSDYGVKLGWRFAGDADEPGMITLSTVAQLTL